MALENALAVVEFALFVPEDANMSAVVEANADDALGNRVTVRAGVAVDGRPDRSGDARQCFESPKSMGNGAVDEILKYGAGLGNDAVVGHRQPLAAETQDDAAESFVGDDQ